MVATGDHIEDSVADQSLREALELERLLVAHDRIGHVQRRHQTSVLIL
jgi:hypothetical protein